MDRPDNLPGFNTPISSAVMPLQTRVAFRVHEELPWLVLPSGVSSQLALDPVLAPIPNVKAWLRGVLNLRGNLVPVFDLGLSQGRTPLPDASNVLIVAPGTEAVALLCCEAPCLMAVRTIGIVPDTDPMAVLSTHVFSSQEGSVYEFDPRVWLRRAGRRVTGHQQD